MLSMMVPYITIQSLHFTTSQAGVSLTPRYKTLPLTTMLCRLFINSAGDVVKSHQWTYNSYSKGQVLPISKHFQAGNSRTGFLRQCSPSEVSSGSAQH